MNSDQQIYGLIAAYLVIELMKFIIPFITKKESYLTPEEQYQLKELFQIHNVKDVLVKDVMSTPIIVIDPYVSLEEAMKTMGKCNVRRLPVIENDELIGIITQKDISRMSPILHEISREWYDITVWDESHLKKQIFSGKCEDCGTLSANLKNNDGRLLCDDCIDALKYE